MNSLFRQILPIHNATAPFTPWRLEKTLLKQACDDLAYQRQLAPDMVTLTMLGAIAILAQGRYDVELPHGSISPVSLNVFIVSDSGEGKTAAQTKIMGPLKRVQEEAYRGYVEQQEAYRRDYDQWQLEHDILRQEVRRTISKNGGTAQREKQALQEHHELRPVPPRPFRILYPNTTAAALYNAMVEGIPTAALASDEGETYFQTSVNQARGHFNNLWDGDDTIVHRANKPDIVLQNTRLSTLLMIQPGILNAHLTSADRDSGWLARFLVCAPMPLRGSRRYDLDTQQPGEAWLAAEARLTALARDNLTLVHDPQAPRTKLRFTPKAARCWMKLANEVEAEMGPGRRYQNCPDHASKLTNNVARVAALIHLFEGNEGGINEETFQASVDICHYYSMHFQQVMMPPPQEEQDAMLLREWFNELRHFNTRTLRYNDVRQRAPSPLRNKKRLREAIDVLMAHNEIGLFTQGKTRMIDLMPQMGPPQQFL